MSSEAQARITINKMLEEAGWRFLPDAQGRRENIICEHRVTRRTFAPSQDLGKDFEHAPDGFVDYVMLNTDERAAAITEAKREGIDPLTGKEQARSYAVSLGVIHIFLSNGLVHYYWNLRRGNPVRISRFLSLEELGKAAEWRPDAARLAAVTVDENYIAVSQDAAWLSYSPADRATVMVNKKIRLLRDYQIDAIRELQKAASPAQPNSTSSPREERAGRGPRRGATNQDAPPLPSPLLHRMEEKGNAVLPCSQHRFLFEMATGTGKTFLAAAIAKLFLRTENALRILFLVDRLELENQAWKNFNAYLANDGISTVIYKQKRRDWMQAQVVVTTIQSLAARNRFLHEFAPTDFQLIISDEAHRTISGNNRAIFEYFIGAKVGLTATPKDYLKGLDDAARQNDPREYERRLLLDTYQTFGSDDGKPTFRYTLLNAVQHTPPYLCNPVTLDARTDITTQMLSDEGYAVTLPPDEDGQETEVTFGKRDYERKFFSDETNLSFIRCFLDNAKCDPITGEPGKTIMFAVSRKHATKLVTLLNEEATRRWPKEYAAGSTFAVQVTSDIPGAQQMTIDFANNNLNGKSKWGGTGASSPRPSPPFRMEERVSEGRERRHAEDFRDYDTSRTRVCVTVGMMTTGYDCEDLLNVALTRPIFSPTDFIQIKGRGTRLFTFKHGEGANQRAAQKDGFALFDFFANCEYFEEDFDYDQKLSLPKGPPEEGGGGGDGGGGIRIEDFTNTSPDPMAEVIREEIGLSGMRIDREMYRERFAQQASEAVASDAVLRQAYDDEDWPAVEERVRRLLFEKPQEFWNLPKLQEVYKSDRWPSLREILARVFGLIPEIPTRGQLADEAFERFVATQPTNAVHSRELKVVFVAFLLDEASRFLLQEGKFAELRARDASLYGSLSQLNPEEREALIGYLQSQVPLKDFEQAA